MWIPINIKTGQEYPAISDKEKAEWEADPMINGGARKRYKFKPATEAAVPAPAPQPKTKKEAPLPVEAKRIETPQDGE